MRTCRGEWNGEMRAKYHDDRKRESVFIDVRKMEESQKYCRPVKQQEEMESRRFAAVLKTTFTFRNRCRLWRHVSAALHENDIETASKGKHWLEQRQRLQVIQRAARQEEWRTKVLCLLVTEMILHEILQHFEAVDEMWEYKTSLAQRMQKK